MKISRGAIPFVLAVGLGLSYALLARYVFGDAIMAGHDLLSLVFLVVMPIALGAVTVHFTPSDEAGRKNWGLGPFWVVVCFLISAFLFHLEGLICLLLISPLFLFLSFMGGLLYQAMVSALRRPRDKNLLAAGFALLPYLLAPLESHLPTPDSYRLVENYIDIAAPAPVVWQHIIRVAPIDRRALGHSPIDILGFPHPVEATLSHEGVGGVRHATFERGVEFIETVDDWQPLRRLSFSIVPNTATIPPTTFDEHVTVGGQYFDVLRGTYELQPLGPGRTRLVLYSQQRLSTHLNWYAGLWTRYIMSEIQARILGVLKQRCEAAAPAAVAASRP